LIFKSLSQRCKGAKKIYFASWRLREKFQSTKIMVQEAVAKIDEAALALVQALNEYGPQVEPYLGPDERACIECVRDDVAALRRALLGAQMGPLYWDPQGAGDEAVPPANPT
jgi:hypothetical protein